MRAAGLAGAGGAVAVAALIVLPAAAAVSPQAAGNVVAAPKTTPPKKSSSPPVKTSKPASPPTTSSPPPTTSSPPPSAPAPRPTPCQPQKAGRPAADIKTEPWAQQRLGFTQVWQLTQGAGVKVAVVDSGVDGHHPQLSGHVSSFDVTGTGDQDCEGHGTEVAGIIAARDMRQRQVPFVGVAPQAEIISIKMAIRATDNDPHFVAKAIRQAADMGAKVINVSSQTPDYPFLKDAVLYAQRKDALIVAAAGNVQNQSTGATEPSYPAEYPHVVSVGAVGPDGQLYLSNSLTRVSVVAPGKEVVSTYPNATYLAESGTSFATPYVAGVAALIRADHPLLSAIQVEHRITATADGGTVKGTGSGMVNPVQAVTAVLPEENGKPPAAAAPRPVAVSRPAQGDTLTATIAFSVAGGALTIALGVAVAAAIVPAGRRRGWRPGRGDRPRA